MRRAAEFLAGLLVAAALLFLLVAYGPVVFGASVPTFTELETARLDAIAQEGRAIDAEQRILALMRERWQAKVTAFKAKAEADRPGWTWDAETGKWSEVKK